MAKTVYSFKADDPLFAGLVAVRERDGIPCSVQIRRAITKWLAEKKVEVQQPQPEVRHENT
jgi:hypothetical protein